MADRKPRTNWSDKIRRTTGAVTLLIVVLVVLLCIFLPGKSKKEVKPEPVATLTEPVSKLETEQSEKTPQEPTKAPEPEEALIAQKIEEPSEDKSEDSSHSVLIETPVFAEPEAVLEIIEENTAEDIQIAESESIEPIITEEAKTEVSNASFDIYGYGVSCTWSEESFTALSDNKGLLSESDIRAFALYEVEKYGSLLLDNTEISFQKDGFSLTYPEGINVEEYIPVLQSEIKEYVDFLFGEEKEEVKEEPLTEKEEIVEEEFYSSFFDVYGYGVSCFWNEDTFVAVSDTKDFLRDEDIRAFTLYETEKYGTLLDGIAIYVIDDGFALSYPKGIRVEEYIPVLQSEIKEYVDSFLQGEEKEEEVPTVEKKTGTGFVSSSFSVSYKVSYSWKEELSSALSTIKKLISEVDLRSFLLYEAEKYGDSFEDNTELFMSKDGIRIFSPDGMRLEDFVSLLKNDIREFKEVSQSPQKQTVNTPVFSSAEAAMAPEEESESFSVLGYGVNTSWIGNKLTSRTELKGLVSESDVRAFAQYAVEKYSLLKDYTAIEFVEDGFVLTYPEGIDPSLYIPLYKEGLEEYVTALLYKAAPVSQSQGIEAEVDELESAPIVEAAASIPEFTSVEVKESENVPVAPEVASAPVLENKVKEASSKALPEKTEVEAPVIEEKKSEEAKADSVQPLAISIEQSPKAERILNNKFKLGLGIDCEIGKSMVIVLPRLDASLEFSNILGSATGFGAGGRFDISSTVSPRDVSAEGNGLMNFGDIQSWLFDGTIDAKLMFYYNFKSAQLYGGVGAGFYFASPSHYLAKHAEKNHIPSYQTAFVLTAVAGCDWKFGGNIGMFAEVGYKYFFESTDTSHLLSASLGISCYF